VNWLEKKIGKFAIPHLTIAIVILTAVVTGYDITIKPGLGEISAHTLFSDQPWRAVFFPFLIPAGSLFGPIVGLLLYLYIFWIFGSMLESLLGDFKYNLFVFTGFFLIFVGSYFYPLGAYILDLTILMGVATRVPDMTIMLFFILPVRIKWIAIVFAVLLFLNPVLMAVQAQFFPLIGVIIATLNYPIFFWPDIRSWTGRPVRKTTFKIKNIRPDSIHKCEVCGRTENDDVSLEFRFCNGCTDHEYCIDHLYNHEHR
jgi:hypothetical protein